jgi:hypothetical protein
MAKKVARKRGAKRSFWKDMFLPHKGNGHHPRALRGNIIIGAICLVVVIEIAVLAQTFYFSQSQTMTASVLPAVVADLTNQQRTDNGLDALNVSPLLTEAAQDKANDMAAKGYFSHVSPSGQLPWYWFQQVGYNYEFAGENLAINFTDSSDVVTAWMNSPMHRANILKQQYTDIGIGIAEGMYQGSETTFVVQFFGTPEPATPTVTQPATPAAQAPVAAAKPAPVAQPNPAQVAPTTPVETGAATPIPANAPPGTPQILGVQTQNTQQVTPWMRIVSSPQTYATYFLLALAAILIALILIAFIPRTFRISERLPHPNALLNGAALLAVIFGVMIINQNFLGGVRVNVPDSQNASVVRAVEATQ